MRWTSDFATVLTRSAIFFVLFDLVIDYYSGWVFDRS